MSKVRHNHKRLAPFGKRLAERQTWNNPPDFAAVYVGAGAWQEAKRWNERPWNIDTANYPALVMPSDHRPYHLHWPVNGCVVPLHRMPGPNDDFILELVKELLKCGARVVTIINEFPGVPARIVAKYWAKDRQCQD